MHQRLSCGGLARGSGPRSSAITVRLARADDGRARIETTRRCSLDRVLNDRNRLRDDPRFAEEDIFAVCAF